MLSITSAMNNEAHMTIVREQSRLGQAFMAHAQPIKNKLCNNADVLLQSETGKRAALQRRLDTAGEPVLQNLCKSVWCSSTVICAGLMARRVTSAHHSCCAELRQIDKRLSTVLGRCQRFRDRFSPGDRPAEQALEHGGRTEMLER